MPLEVITPRETIEQYVQTQLALKVEALIAQLHYIAESTLRIAREQGSYTDRTGNLRNSMGYVIAVDGQVIARAGFRSKDEDGAAFAETLARTTEDKAVLVVCAGMSYATYVSARGYDVLDSAEIEAKVLAKKTTQAMNRKSVTSREVQTTIYKLLQASELCKAVNGNLYHATTRPRDSHKEDIIVRYTQGTSGEIQQGVVTILIYTEPIPAKDGTPQEDIARTLQIERLVTDWAERLPTGRYLFTITDTAQTLYAHEERQYFTSIRIKYNHY